MYSTALIFCCEKGVLEPQTKLLVSSLQKFANLPQSVKLICLSPRKYFRPSKSTIAFLDKNNVEYIDENLNKEMVYNPYANKPIVCGYIEKSGQFDNIIFLDSDTFAFGDFLSGLHLKKDIYLKPVFYKQIGCEGVDDPNHDLWEFISGIFSIKNLSYTHTFVSNEKILGYWNSGFIASSTNLEIFTKWNENFQLLLKAKKWRNERYFFMDQLALSSTIHQLKITPIDPEKGTNYPISFHNEISAQNKISKITELKLAHHFGSFDKMISNMKKVSGLSSPKIEELEHMINQINPDKSFSSSTFYKLIQLRNTNLQKALYFRKKYFGVK